METFSLWLVEGLNILHLNVWRTKWFEFEDGIVWMLSTLNAFPDIKGCFHINKIVMNATNSGISWRSYAKYMAKQQEAVGEYTSLCNNQAVGYTSFYETAGVIELKVTSETTKNNAILLQMTIGVH